MEDNFNPWEEDPVNLSHLILQYISSDPARQALSRPNFPARKMMHFHTRSVQWTILWAVFALLFCPRSSAGMDGSLCMEPGMTIHECWTKKELMGEPADKSIRPMPSAPAGTAPARLQPTVIGPELPPKMKNSIRSVKISGDRKLIALTFDLCEREKEISGYDNDVVNFLRENKVRATFFASGKWMRSHTEKTMQLMADPLFEIGNHGWSHRNIRTLARKSVEEEVLFAQAQYELIWEELQKRPCIQSCGLQRIPRVPTLFRFPFGTCSPESLNFVQSIGLAAIQWDIISGDAAKGQGPSAIANSIMRQAKSGSIVVMHANGRGHGTAGALPIFVPKLKQQGFNFVTVNELLAGGTPVAANDCYEEKPGDNLRYDRIFREGESKN